MDVKDNIAIWNSIEHWETGKMGNNKPLLDGEKWSRGWGSSRYQWHASLLPRIHRFLPAGTILEIACGRGRWSQYLMEQCDRIILQDISDNCVDYCRQRFADKPHVDYLVGEGSNLPGVPDGSVDFVFSFDSLVHADIDVLEGYVREIARVLKPGGAGFIHHSNLAALDQNAIEKKRLRDPTVSAEKVNGFLGENGLSCEIYELMPWDSDHAAKGQCVDALLTLRKGPGTGAPRYVENTKSLEIEKDVARVLHSIYGDSGSEGG